MTETEIRDAVRRVIAKVTNIKPEQLGDQTRFREDLAIDSLSLLEIRIEVDYRFQLGLPDGDERMAALDCVDDTVRFVQELLAEKAA